MEIKFLLCLAIIYCVYINEINACLCGCHHGSDFCSCNIKALRAKPQKKIQFSLQKSEPIDDQCNCCQKKVKPDASCSEIEWIEEEEEEEESEVEVKMEKKEKEQLFNTKNIKLFSKAFGCVMGSVLDGIDIVCDTFATGETPSVEKIQIKEKVSNEESEELKIHIDELEKFKFKISGISEEVKSVEEKQTKYAFYAIKEKQDSSETIEIKLKNSPEETKLKNFFKFYPNLSAVKTDSNEYEIQLSGKDVELLTKRDKTFTFKEKTEPDPKEYKIMLSKSDGFRLITDALTTYKTKEKVKIESSAEYIPFRIFKHLHGGKHNIVDPVSVGLAYDAAKKAKIARIEDNVQYGFKKPLLIEIEKKPKIIKEENLYRVNGAALELKAALNPKRLKYDDLGYVPAKQSNVIYVQHNHKHHHYQN